MPQGTAKRDGTPVPDRVRRPAPVPGLLARSPPDDAPGGGGISEVNDGVTGRRIDPHDTLYRCVARGTYYQSESFEELGRSHAGKCVCGTSSFEFSMPRSFWTARAWHHFDRPEYEAHPGEWQPRAASSPAASHRGVAGAFWVVVVVVMVAWLNAGDRSTASKSKVVIAKPIPSASVPPLTQPPPIKPLGPPKSDALPVPRKADPRGGAELSTLEESSIDSACSHERLMEGPAAYNWCLDQKLKSR